TSGPGGSQLASGPAGPQLAHELVAGCARREPQAPAVVSPTRALPYAELEARANRLARILRDGAGIGPEVPVLVAPPRCPGLIVALLAVLKAGGVYVPVDPAAPAAHLAAVAGQVGSRFALALPGARAALPASVAVLDVELAGPAPPDPGPPEVTIHPG